MAKNLNIAALRAQAALAAPIITAPDGREFAVGALSLDAYLGIIDLQEQFSDFNAAERTPGSVTQKQLMAAMRDAVSEIIPGFPAGSLSLEELLAVVAFCQTAATPEAEAVTEAGAGAEAGESDKANTVRP